MAQCPKCNTNVSVKISDQIECPNCRSHLASSFSPQVKMLLMLIIFFEFIATLIIVVIASAINYPFFPKWLIACSILLGLGIVTLLVIFFVANKLVVLRLKSPE